MGSVGGYGTRGRHGPAWAAYHFLLTTNAHRARLRFPFHPFYFFIRLLLQRRCVVLKAASREEDGASSTHTHTHPEPRWTPTYKKQQQLVCGVSSAGVSMWVSDTRMLTRGGHQSEARDPQTVVPDPKPGNCCGCDVTPQSPVDQ